MDIPGWSRVGTGNIQHLVEDHTRCADLAVGGHLEGILPQDGIEAAGDACSIKRQSKEGALGKVDHDENAWEGGMFPFCDEGMPLLF